MKRLAVIVAVGLLFALSNLAVAQAPPCAKTCKTPCAAAKSDQAKHAAILTGEILEAGCFLEGGKTSADNAECIKKCVASGMPMAFLAEDNSLYLIIKCHDSGDAYTEAIKLAAKKVEIKGYIHEKNGLKAIAVTSVQPVEVASK